MPAVTRRFLCAVSRRAGAREAQILLVAALGSGNASAAAAHSWYPKECCSNHDCMPADGIESGSGGFIVRVGDRRICIPYGYSGARLPTNASTFAFAILPKKGDFIRFPFASSCRRKVNKRDVGAPNLTDSYWIYGGEIKNIIASVHGARAGTLGALGPRQSLAQSPAGRHYSRAPDRCSRLTAC